MPKISSEFWVTFWILLSPSKKGNQVKKIPYKIGQEGG